MIIHSRLSHNLKYFKPETQPVENQFLQDVLAGLTSTSKSLPSKYFYDETGDKLFQQIMQCEDYYPTRCEMDIFQNRTRELVGIISNLHCNVDIIELGAGDCSKSIHLLKALSNEQVNFKYIPIDISKNIIANLESSLPEQIPGIEVKGMNGDYFEMLNLLSSSSTSKKVILCLGGNIANMTINESESFCKQLRSYLNPGDIAIIGFDLVKNPRIIYNAYYDREGITSRFNLNLLTRINRELNANFNISIFEHFCSYDPLTGACRSFLVCTKETDVQIGSKTIHLKKDECIWTEISQKYSRGQIIKLAKSGGFKPTQMLTDHKEWFVDAIWTAI